MPLHFKVVPTKQATLRSFIAPMPMRALQVVDAHDEAVKIALIRRDQNDVFLNARINARVRCDRGAHMNSFRSASVAVLRIRLS